MHVTYINKYIIINNVLTALNEDINQAVDLTASLIANNRIVKASIITREDMVLCGSQWATYAFTLIDPQTVVTWYAEDGQQVAKGATLCAIEGPAQSLLTAERTAINFLQTLSGVASCVARYVNLVADLPVQIMDTRKTIPGLRLAEKYAVVCGGGYNQRFGLYDAVLIKENHIAACGGVKEALLRAEATLAPEIAVQIEVETYQQLVEAIEYGAKLILLDNMSLALIKQCVEYASGKAILEVSGDVNLSNVRDYALTGINRISIGALTKNIQAINLSMRIK